MSETYGVGGDVMIDIWKREYEEIEGHVKFGGASTDAFLPLMQKISDHMDERFRKRDKWKKFGIIMVFVCIAAFFGISLLNEVGVMILIGSIVLTVIAFKMKKAREKEIMAAIDFDKAYFDGEICYRRKNG